jgi:general L-amino acid transport system substrate-binding protein
MKRKLIMMVTILDIIAILVVACSQAAQPTPATAQPTETTAAASGQTTTEATSAPAAAPTDTSAAAAGTGAAPTGTSAAQGSAQAGNTLSIIKQRGKVMCGGNRSVPGFGFIKEDGSFEGFDIDLCRALAAAIFDDPNAVEVRHLSATERFPALQTGEVDVLSRNTTWSLNRDTALGLDFGIVTFYDGQGILVRADSGVKALEDLGGATICVQSGTTTELNLADQMAARNIEYEPAVFEDADATRNAYDAGRCDAFTTDKSGIVSQIPALSDPAGHVMLDVTLSKEPLGPATRHGDNQWHDIVVWTVYAMIQGEEFGITTANLEDMIKANSEGVEGANPEIQRYLGLTGTLGQDLGLTNDFAQRIIRHVGNYGESFDRNLGAGSQFKLERGLNDLWTNGGLLYSPPFR